MRTGNTASGARRRAGWKPEGPRRRLCQGSVYDSRYPQGHALTKGAEASELRIPSIHRFTHTVEPTELIALEGSSDQPVCITVDPRRKTICTT